MLILLAASNICWADSLYFKIGPTLNIPNGAANKMFSLGLSESITSLWDYQFEVGTFTNLTNGSLLYWSLEVGPTLDFGAFYTKFLTGPAMISYTNQYLNTAVQISSDLEMGLKDRRDITMGLGYKHFSNAGITSPNLGRDFLYLKLSIPLRLEW